MRTHYFVHDFSPLPRKNWGRGGNGEEEGGGDLTGNKVFYLLGLLSYIFPFFLKT